MQTWQRTKGASCQRDVVEEAFLDPSQDTPPSRRWSIKDFHLHSSLAFVNCWYIMASRCRVSHPRSDNGRCHQWIANQMEDQYRVFTVCIHSRSSPSSIFLYFLRKAKQKANSEGMDSFKGVSFNGAEAIRFFEHFDDFVDACETPTHVHAKESKMVCDKWLTVWNCIRFRVPFNQLLFKARAVEDLGRAFVEALIGWATPECVHYYAHALVCHLPSQICSCPMDIMDVSGAGIEEVNQEVKRIIK